ncbi:MAG: transcription termination/antitermination protein NusG [Myxococcota bacterium]
MKWYAINTLSGSEAKAIQALEQRWKMHELEDRFGRVLLPSETVIDPKTKRKHTRRFFPGYVLVEMVLDKQTYYLVKETPKIIGFVGGSKNPPPVPESEVERIYGLVREDDPEAPKPVLDFEIGEEVRLTEGRYASMRGRIDEINDTRGKLRVIINMFGRDVPTELGFHQVEKLNED